MSWRIANECAERRFGSAARKQIIMFLADKASDDGSGIWCSKKTIQRHTELGESTVKRTINDFLTEGILVETGRRPCKNGYTVIYRIEMVKVLELESTEEPELATGFTVDPVHPDTPRGSTVGGVRGPERTPNHPKTIQEPPTRKREAVGDEEAEKVLAVYPPDRLRGKAECLKRIRAALDEGLDTEDLNQAVKAYATESAGFTRSKVCFSDNWFKARRWEPFIEAARQKREDAVRTRAVHSARLVDWIDSRSPMCAHITPAQVADLVAQNLVTPNQLNAAGLSA